MPPISKTHKNLLRQMGWAAGLALTVAVSACNDETKKPLTQVAARVNGQEVSIHQINAVLAREGVPGADSKEVSRQVLERLIDQQALINRAVESGLDREPDVVLQLDMARRQILSQAYLDKILSGLNKPSDADIRAYYAAHPALFAQRRIFDLQEVRVPSAPKLREALVRRASEGGTIDELVDYVADHGMSYKLVESVRTAEQIPLDQLPALARLRDKDTGFFDNQTSYSLVRVRSSRLAPVSEAEARPAIEAFLLNLKKQRVVAEEVRKLRAKSNIEYMGMFADASAGGQR